MNFELNHYYHLYNRSNNAEIVFQSHDNYVYFLSKFRKHMQNLCTVIAYCLMPTHFHFLVRVESDNSKDISNQIGIILRSYTHAINVNTNRHGSLFQPHTKAKFIDDEEYLLTLIGYIHQNPVRAKLVERISDWKYSSYLDLIGQRDGILSDKDFITLYFKSSKDFEKYSEEMIAVVRKDYWV